MSNDNIRVYYYNNEWHDFDYLHDNHGITYSQSTKIFVYDDLLASYPAWIENDTINHYIWVVKDNRWYPRSELPYWIKTNNSLKLYLIKQCLSLDEYEMQGSTLYDYNRKLYSYKYLHDNFGITKTPSEIYLIKSNAIKSWYNKDEVPMPYWSVDVAKWVDYINTEGQTYSDINAIGSISTFTYYNPEQSVTHYGDIVDSSLLQPICVNFPNSGLISRTSAVEIKLTGKWKILTECITSSKTNPCIVIATKVSE